MSPFAVFASYVLAFATLSVRKGTPPSEYVQKLIDLAQAETVNVLANGAGNYFGTLACTSCAPENFVYTNLLYSSDEKAIALAPFGLADEVRIQGDLI